MSTKKVNLKELRTAASERQDFSIAAIARRIGKSRWTLYHLHLCPDARKKIKDEYGV